MLVEEKVKKVKEFVHSFSQEELVWISGYLAGLLEGKAINGNFTEPSTITATTGSSELALKKMTICYATESGNSKKLATALAAMSKKKGVRTKLTSLEQYKFSELEKEDHFIVIMSTQGEGEPPSAGLKFYDSLHAQNLNLNALHFAVLGLGDTAYPLFCKAAEDVHNRLRTLGGKNILDLQKCDVDFEEDAKNWFDLLFSKLENAKETATPPQTHKTAPPHKKNYVGTISHHVNLNGKTSDKKTYHIEISCDEEINYLPGDSLGVYPHNDAKQVEAILNLTETNAEKIISLQGENKTLLEWLSSQLAITHLSKSVIKSYAELCGQQIPEVRMDLLDLLRIYPLQKTNTIEEVLSILHKLTPRLYSIASSPAVNPTEVHITVAKNTFSISEEIKFGLCSTYLESLPVGTLLHFYIHKNNAFRLPSADKDVIMIGPGTGIAPFRSFVAERDALGAEGKNWLFFGDRSFTEDFLYQTEWQQHVAMETLHKINVAWSRDGKEKHYVQHEIAKEANTFLQWVENGAYIYICGDKNKMCKDVEETIIEMAKKQNQWTDVQASEWLDELENTGRYLKDVY